MKQKQYSTELIRKMRKIADRADFAYSNDKYTDLSGSAFASECFGSGPYHEETELLIGENDDKYFFMEESIAPMAGHFKWVILIVLKSEIKTQEELECLESLLREERFKSK